MSRAGAPSSQLLWLASTSPRRRQLLQQAGIAFALCEPGPEYASGGDFDHGETGAPQQLASARAKRKALHAKVPADAELVLGVDTVVDLDGQELGKARDRQHAQELLARLADREHLVHTAHCLLRGSLVREEVTTASVRFLPCAAAQWAAYLDGGNWRGKAGAYGIQDPDAPFIELRQGELDTVIGLSVAAVRRLLAAVGA